MIDGQRNKGCMIDGQRNKGWMDVDGWMDGCGWMIDGQRNKGWMEGQTERKIKECLMVMDGWTN